jgi:glutamate dehydrogenase/leucine dehydrogenase
LCGEGRRSLKDERSRFEKRKNRQEPVTNTGFVCYIQQHPIPGDVKIAVLGTGVVGQTITAKLAQLGHAVVK